MKDSSRSKARVMIAAKLAVVAVLALLLGSASCLQTGFSNGNGGGNPIPMTQPPKHPPAMTPKPKPPAYHPPKTSPSPPPPTPTYPPTRLSPPPPTASYQPPPNPSPTPPMPAPPPPTLTYPPTRLSPPPPTPSYPPPNPRSTPPTPTPPPPTPTYPPTSLSPPPTTPSYPPPPPTPTPPPPTPSYPPPNPSPPPPTPTTPSYPPTNPSPPPPMPTPPQPTPTPTPTPTYPPTSPSPPPPTPPPPSPPPLPANSDDAGKKLNVGYYENKCGHSVDVEAIVRKHVSGFDDGIKAGLIQLFFHDCFVRGCDASVLLDPTSTNQNPEKLGVPNFPSLRGYEVIDAAKDELEEQCPNVVSCADIVAFAARDASYFLSSGRISFDVPAGRYDGNVSLASETLPNLPPPFAGFDQLVKMFADKGLNAFDMVTLSGAHSIGRSHCSSFIGDRLVSPSSTSLDMDPAFAATLQASCASVNGTDNTVMQDYETPDDMDNQYYQNVLDRKVLFTSDAALTSDDMANNLVRVYAIFPWLWQDKFAEAMVKMGRIEIKTDSTGEIRKNCRVVNSKP